MRVSFNHIMTDPTHDMETIILKLQWISYYKLAWE
jgi:hypothetical protein